MTRGQRKRRARRRHIAQVKADQAKGLEWSRVRRKFFLEKRVRQRAKEAA